MRRSGRSTAYLPRQLQPEQHAQGLGSEQPAALRSSTGSGSNVGVGQVAALRSGRDRKGAGENNRRGFGGRSDERTVERKSRTSRHVSDLVGATDVNNATIGHGAATTTLLAALHSTMDYPARIKDSTNSRPPS